MAKFIADVKKYWPYARYAAKAELKKEVAGNRLGWLWWFLDPLLFMCVYSFVAQFIFNKGELYLSAFIFLGRACWVFFENTVKNSIVVVKQNSSIVKKVYLPKYILIIQRMSVNAIRMTISFILVAGTMALYRVPLSWRILYAIPCLIVLFLITFGISCFMLHCGVFFEDLRNIMDAVLKLVFYMSGVFYSIANRTSGWIQFVLLKVNPVALIMNSMRNSVLYNTNPDFIPLAIWALIGLCMSSLGVMLIYKSENTYVKVI